MNKAEKREKKKNDHGIVDFMRITKHFFKNLTTWIEEMEDPRNQSYITYTQADFGYLAIMKNICSQESMRMMDESFNNENCIGTLRLMSGNQKLKEMPHYDTLNFYLERLSPDCLSDLRRKMVTSLIRGKQFNKNRLMGKYWRLIIDGTGLFCFKERHCENCLCTIKKKEDGTLEKLYYHKVLEAKLVLSENIVISLGTEFIENEKEDVSKQDCELKAAKRLMKRMKEEYPRLPICILGDGLYSVEPMMKICREKRWEYIFNLKEGRQKNISKDYEWLCKGGAAIEIEGICKEKGTGRFINHVEEVSGKKEVFNIYEYNYATIRNKREIKVNFMWVSSLEITERNLVEMINTARKRWKIENEGFNNQKNGIYKIEHLNSRNSNAMKNHYLLTQIADILMQLYLAWNPFIREIGQSIKNTSSQLLESFRRHTVTDEDVSYIARYTTVYLE